MRRARRADVYSEAFDVARYEYGVSSQRGQRRRVERRSELAEVVVPLGDLPEEEIGLGPHAARRVRPQRLEATCEVRRSRRRRRPSPATALRPAGGARRGRPGRTCTRCTGRSPSCGRRLARPRRRSDRVETRLRRSVDVAHAALQTGKARTRRRRGRSRACVRWAGGAASSIACAVERGLRRRVDRRVRPHGPGRATPCPPGRSSRRRTRRRRSAASDPACAVASNAAPSSATRR